MAAPYKAWVCGRTLAGIAVWIPPRTWTSVSCECCVLSGKSLCDRPITYPEESLPSVVCLCVIWKPQQWGGLGPLGLLSHEKKMKLPPRSPKWPIPSRIFRWKFITGRSYRRSYHNVINEQMPGNITVPHTEPTSSICCVTPEWKSRRLSPSLVVLHCEKMAGK